MVEEQGGLRQSPEGGYILEGLVLDKGLHMGLAVLAEKAQCDDWRELIRNAIVNYHDALTYDDMEFRSFGKLRKISAPESNQEFKIMYSIINKQCSARFQRMMGKSKGFVSIFDDPQYRDTTLPQKESIHLESNLADMLVSLQERFRFSQWAHTIALAVRYQEVLLYHKQRGYTIENMKGDRHDSQ